VLRRILGGIAYVQKGLKNLEDVESSALGLRPGKGRILEDWESVVFSALGLRPGGTQVTVFLQTWEGIKVFFFWSP